MGLKLKRERSQIRGTVILVVGAFIWGMAFAFQRMGAGAVGPNTFLACRSWLAVVFLAALVLVRKGKQSTTDNPKREQGTRDVTVLVRKGKQGNSPSAKSEQGGRDVTVLVRKGKQGNNPSAKSEQGIRDVTVLVRKGKQGNNPSAKSEQGMRGVRQLLVGGVLCGVALFAASVTQQYSMSTASTAKAGFITALYVVFVPIFGIFVGKRPRPKIWLCVAISVIGLYFLCMAGRGSLSMQADELVLLLCAALFAVQILLVSRYSPIVDGVQLSLVMFVTEAVLASACMLIWERPSWADIVSAWIPIVYCGIFSSGIGYTLQIIGQRDLDPTVASLAMCLESVFSALGGWLILHETMTPTEIGGCALMFGAIVLSQIEPRGGPTP